jgi:hypothetical protein
VNWRKVAAKVLKAGKDKEGKVVCEHCLKHVGVTKSTTTMGSPFMKKHSIGRRGSMACVGSGVPVRKKARP